MSGIFKDAFNIVGFIAITVLEIYKIYIFNTKSIYRIVFPIHLTLNSFEECSIFYQNTFVLNCFNYKYMFGEFKIW